VFHAKKAGTELAGEELAAHMKNLTAAEAEVARIETMIAQAAQRPKTATSPLPRDAKTPPPAGGGYETNTPPPAAGGSEL
jgi:hypothetical protein